MPAPRLAVTGGIGSGKSTVTGILAGLGAAVIDTDAIAHELTAAGGGAIAAVATAFGPAAIAADGALDRAHLRARVFAEPGTRQRLEAILHPLILEQCRLRAQALAGTAPLLVFDVPLLVEAAAVRHGLALDRVLVIDCPPDRQLAHCLERGGMDAAQIAAIIAAQAPRGARLDLADDVIVNTGTRDELALRVRRLWQRYAPGTSSAREAPVGAAPRGV